MDERVARAEQVVDDGVRSGAAVEGQRCVDPVGGGRQQRQRVDDFDVVTRLAVDGRRAGDGLDGADIVAGSGVHRRLPGVGASRS